MGLKYTSTFYSTHGTLYQVLIYDANYASTSTVIKLIDPGFTLDYQGQGTDIFDPIKGSQLKVHLCIEDNATGTALLSWIQSTVLANNEDRFTVELRREGLTEWYGVILPDLSGMADQSKPFEFVLTAACGLARLKDFAFDYASSTDDTLFTNLLYEILKYTPAYIHSINTALFSTVVNWWEDQMPAKADDHDPLNLTYVNAKVFTKRNAKGENEPFNCYDALEAICKHWGMRVMMTKGRFKFIQLGAYEGGYAQYERFYAVSDGLYYNKADFTPQVDINVSTGSLPRVLSGGQWNYYPPLKAVYLKLPFQNKNFLNGETTLDYLDVITTPVSGGSQAFIFATTLRYSLDPTNKVAPYFIKLRVKLKLDSTYWAAKTASGLAVSWSASSDYVYHTIQVAPYLGEVNFSFITDTIPSGSYSTIDFEIIVDSILDSTGATVTDNYIYRVTNTTSLTFASSSQTESIISYKAVNTNTVINSYDIDEPDAIFGDWYFESSYGTLYVWTGSNAVLSGGSWKIDGTGTGYPINLLRVRDILAAQAYATPKYQGAIVGSGTLSAWNSIGYGGRVYIMTGATLTGIQDEYNGEWVEVDYVRANVVSDEPVLGGGEGNQDLQRSIGFIGGDLAYLSQQDYSLYETISTDTTGVSANVTYICTASLNVDLPPAAEWIRYDNRSIEITVMNQDGAGSNVTVTPYGSETINGASDVTLSRYHSVTLISDGTEIYIKSSFKHT